MSEPVPTRTFGDRANVAPYRIEMPANPVGIRMVPHMLASDPVDQGGDEGVQAPLVKTGKLEVRFDGSSLPTKKDAKKTIDWEKVAYNAAHQTAYYRQVNDNAVARAEEYERKYTTALRDYQAMVADRDERKRDMDRLRPLINAAFSLKDWWAYVLLPKALKKLVAPV